MVALAGAEGVLIVYYLFMAISDSTYLYTVLMCTVTAGLAGIEWVLARKYELNFSEEMKEPLNS